MSEHARYRAAGQTVAALAHGAPIDSVDIDGIVMRWRDVSVYERPRADVLADIAIGLCGIAAEGRYGFGATTSNHCVVSWCLSAGQLYDFGVIRKLVRAIDPDDDCDLLLRAWNQAIDLVADRASWSAVEAVAAALIERRLDSFEVTQIAARSLVADPPVAQ